MKTYGVLYLAKSQKNFFFKLDLFAQTNIHKVLNFAHLGARKVVLRELKYT